jgi:hypothetical protein
MNDNNNHPHEEKLEANEVTLMGNNESAKKLSNFWYHNKWTVIIVTFFVATLIIVAVQMLTKVDYDATVTISGPDFINSEAVYYISNDLSEALESDINGDGKRTVSISSYPVFSESELYAINHSQKDNSGSFIKIVEESENLSQYQQFVQYSQTGDSYILIVSKYVYEPLKKTDPSRLAPLSDIYASELPEGALNDGYGIKLSETAVYKNSAKLQSLGDDYIICICKLPDTASKKQTNIYNETIEYFKDLVG